MTDIDKINELIDTISNEEREKIVAKRDNQNHLAHGGLWVFLALLVGLFTVALLSYDVPQWLAFIPLGVIAGAGLTSFYLSLPE